MVLFFTLQVTEPEEEIDELRNFLDSFDGNVTAENEKSATNIDVLLLEFKSLPIKLKYTDNLLIYWESQRKAMPELYALANIVSAVPMTQVSVERLFSSVKFVYSDLRHNLGHKLLEDILLIRSNGLFRQEKTRRKRKNKPNSGKDGNVMTREKSAEN